VDIEFGGEEGSVVLREVSPGGRVDRVTLLLGSLTGEIQTVIGLDLERLRDELRAALAPPSLTGSTSVESVEHDFRSRPRSVMAKAPSGASSRRSFARMEVSTSHSLPIRRF
jgi:hypothetical protein